MFSLSILLILLILMWLLLFVLDKGSDVPYSFRGGGRSKESAPPAPAPLPSAEEQANAQMQALLRNIPEAARLDYQVKASPEYGIIPQTRLQEQARQEIFPEEQKVRAQLVQNVLSQLISPTGITLEQQTAMDRLRGNAVNQFQQQQRLRSNLGGGLYGGRTQAAEERGVGDLLAGFTTEDINRQEQSRLNSINAALPVLQMLFPELGLQTPQFINPVASPESYQQSLVSQRGQDVSVRGQDIQQQMAQQQARAQLQSSLFQALGSAAAAIPTGRASIYAMGGSGQISPISLLRR